MGFHTDVRRQRDRRHAALAAALAPLLPGADPGMEGALAGAAAARADALAGQVRDAYDALHDAADAAPPGPARDALKQAYRWARKALETMARGE